MDYEEKLEWLGGMTLDEVLERYDMVQAIPPSGIKLHCNNEADIEGIINDLSLLFKNRYEEYLNNLYVKASGFEYEETPAAIINCDRQGKDVTISFLLNRFLVFGRNLPDRDDYCDYDGILLGLMDELFGKSGKYDAVKYEGLFSWNYDDNVSTYNYYTEVTNMEENTYARELILNDEEFWELIEEEEEFWD